MIFNLKYGDTGHPSIVIIVMMLMTTMMMMIG